MAQLKMYWLPGTPIKQYALPEGFSVSTYRTEADKKAWCDCCRNGHLIADGGGDEEFDRSILDIEDIDPARDVLFIDFHGEHVGTVTAFVNSEDNTGRMHMVAVREDFRGKGLAKYLTMLALDHLSEKGVRYVHLTTDEFRPSAVKSYLSGGFLPVEYDMGMQDRWEIMLEECGIDSARMLYDDANEYKIIYRRSKAKKIKIGVFGAGRGKSMMDYCKFAENAELAAVCDFRKERLEEAEREYGADGNISYYTEFDEFLKHDTDCIVLANYANEHAPYAIKCLEAGKNVLSEVLPVQTMKEAVELVEAVERTGKVYAYAENYAYMPAPKKMRALYRDGMLGSFEYGEGEYMHNCESGWHFYSFADPKHWRNTMSAFYYCTHSIGPLIHITGLRPVKVAGFEAPFNARMERMGAKAGAFAVEMITLENGALNKSLHGVGPSKGSIWYSIYGSKGRMESAREDVENGGVGTLYVNCDEHEGDNKSSPVITPTDDALTEIADKAGHGGSDYYVMHNLVEKLRGNRNADTVDIYEALDMFLPGMFAYFSVLEGGRQLDIPNLRNPEERDKWRNDTRCTDPAVAGAMLIPSYSKGNPDIPQKNYDYLASLPSERFMDTDTRSELGIKSNVSS